ncbi:hypothetical protein D3C87_325090 [compost metagenome]
MPIIVLHARRWFSPSLCNTYHTVAIEVDGKEWKTTGINYGYGNEYIGTAYAFLKSEGVIPNTMTESEFSRTHGHGFYVVDVPRKKDL